MQARGKVQAWLDGAPMADKGEGRFVADAPTLDRLERDGRIVFRYVGHNPNGALRDIAGITNEGRNVLGMMPHPERAAESLLGSTDGAALFGRPGPQVAEALEAIAEMLHPAAFRFGHEGKAWMRLADGPGAS